jgi:hypothetical protein
MLTRAQPKVRSAPLAAQIDRAELQLRHRQRQVGTHAARLRETALQRLTSPLALLLAGGVGFVAGDFAMRTPTTPAAKSDTRSGWFAGALSLLAVIRSVVAMFPPAPKPPVEPDQTERAPRT